MSNIIIACKKTQIVKAMKWTGENLRELLDFVGPHPKFSEWFTSFKEYEELVRRQNNVFKLFNSDGVDMAMVGDYIVCNSKKEYSILTEVEFVRQYAIYNK